MSSKSSSSLHAPEEKSKNEESESQDVPLDISNDESSGSDVVISKKTTKRRENPKSNKTRVKRKRNRQQTPRNPSISDSGSSEDNKNEQKEQPKPISEPINPPAESAKENPRIISSKPQEDDAVSIVISQPEPVKSISYALIRKKSRLKAVFTFEFTKVPLENEVQAAQGDEVIISAKCKGRHPKSAIAIKNGPEVHMSQPCDLYMIPENSSTEFKLRKSAIDGPILMSAQVTHNMQNLLRPRLITINIEEESGIPKQVLVTRTPKMLRNGMFALDFHNHFTLPSEKNAIFFDQSKGQNSPDLCSVRKTGTDTLEIIASEKLPDLIVFSIGLIMYTANLDV